MSTLSFQGVTSGLQTDALIKAIMNQESLPLDRLKNRQSLNTQRSSALNAMRTSLTSLTLSMAALYDKLASKSVSSTDANNTFVSATASRTANGSYEVHVASVATQGKLGPTMVQNPANPEDPSDRIPATLAVDDPNKAILTGSGNTFSVKGTDGVLKTFELTNNSLNGLRDAINASGAGVTATIINSGKGANPYQLVVTAKETGTGTTGGVVSLATTGDTTVIDSLGITSAGLSSTGAMIAQDAVFSVNGIEMTRQSNTVKDAVDGVTFTLKKGDASNTTTLTVAQDKAAATSGMQDLVSKFNALLKVYKDASGTTKDSSGEVRSGPLAGDPVARSVITQVRSVFGSTPDGLPGTALFRSGAEIGIKTNQDGTLTLDTRIFQDALDKDPDAIARVFAFTGTSTSSSARFVSGGTTTATGEVQFDLTYGEGGAVSGSLTYDGITYGGLTGTNGTLLGPAGSPLEGLNLAVTASGSGTLTLSRGIGQKLQDLISGLTSYGGTIETTRSSIQEQNRTLTTRIDSLQVLLDKRQAALKAKFDQMESVIAQLRAASGSLSGLG